MDTNEPTTDIATSSLCYVCGGTSCDLFAHTDVGRDACLATENALYAMRFAEQRERQTAAKAEKALARATRANVRAVRARIAVAQARATLDESRAIADEIAAALTGEVKS